MKRFLLIAVLAAALAALLAGTALAGQVNPPTQGYGPVAGMRSQSADVAGTCGMCGGAGAMGGMMRGGALGRAGQHDAVAELLEMTAEDLQAERLAGRSLAEIAADKGVLVEELTEAILKARKANLDQLVVDGKLTSAQAELMLERMEAQVKVMLEQKVPGPMMGRGQGMRGGGRNFSR